MGVYDGREVYELVGTFLLDKISVKYDKNSIDLYRNNGLSLFKTQLERIKKSLQKAFKEFGLEIVAQSNLKSDSHLPKKFIFICFNKSPLKMIKNAF